MTRLPAGPRDIPAATVARLPVYLRALHEIARTGAGRVSSGQLAEASGVLASQLRKDLSHLGSHGVRGVGYTVGRLIAELTSALGLTRTWPVAIVGMGNLGRALAAYRGFATEGFDVVALLDRDQHIVGEQVGELVIRHIDELPRLAPELGIAIGVVATPATSAQSVTDALVTAGVHAVLNFAPTPVVAPPDVSVRRVDLATDLHVLAFLRERDRLSRLGGIGWAG